MDKDLRDKNLGELIKEINGLFRVKKDRKFPPVHMFSLVCWEDGYWSIDVTDDWHKWVKNNIEIHMSRYWNPEDACRHFLMFVKMNKINIKKLQSD